MSVTAEHFSPPRFAKPALSLRLCHVICRVMPNGNYSVVCDVGFASAELSLQGVGFLQRLSFSSGSVSVSVCLLIKAQAPCILAVLFSRRPRNPDSLPTPRRASPASGRPAKQKR